MMLKYKIESLEFSYGYSPSSLLNFSINFINRMKSMQLACIERAKSIPENATLRKEYVKCGKETCEELHGPYYYAYWKDPENKKLKKKYIGTRAPKTIRRQLIFLRIIDFIFIFPTASCWPY
jgi:hypothetical protein